MVLDSTFCGWPNYHGGLGMLDSVPYLVCCCEFVVVLTHALALS